MKLSKLWHRPTPGDPADRSEAMRVLRQLRRQSESMARTTTHGDPGSAGDDLRYTVAGPGTPF